MRPSDLDIELYLVGDLDAAGAARVEAAAQATPELATYLAERRAEKAAFQLSRPRIAFEAPAPSKWLTWLKRWAAPASVVAVASLALFFLVLPPPDGDGLRARGTSLPARLIAKRNAVVFSVTQQTPLRPLDRIRLEVTLGAPATCSAVGADAKGGVTILHDRLALGGGIQVFPQSVVLDDAMGRERIVIACGGITAEALVDAVKAQSLQALAVPVAVLAYDKEEAGAAAAP